MFNKYAIIFMKNNASLCMLIQTIRSNKVLTHMPRRVMFIYLCTFPNQLRRCVITVIVASTLQFHVFQAPV